MFTNQTRCCEICIPSSNSYLIYLSPYSVMINWWGTRIDSRRGWTRKFCLIFSKFFRTVILPIIPTTLEALGLITMHRWLYFVSSSRERLWRHWAGPRIHAARCILYSLIPVFLFERVRKHTSCTRDDKRLCLENALTSRSFSGWDKV